MPGQAGECTRTARYVPWCPVDMRRPDGLDLLLGVWVPKGPLKGSVGVLVGQQRRIWQHWGSATTVYDMSWCATSFLRGATIDECSLRSHMVGGDAAYALVVIYSFAASLRN